MRLRENGLGVMTVTFLTNPSHTKKYVGILGSPDKDDTNDFMRADGTVLDKSIYFKNDVTNYEGIHYDFGETWMVKKEESSLFKQLPTFLHFNDYHFPEKKPFFGDPDSDGLVSNVRDSTCYDTICGDFDGFLRDSCCYDYEVTKDAELVRRIMADAKKEDVIQSILKNTLPTIEGGVNQTKSGIRGGKENFVIQSLDENGDNISATLVRNDGDLFKLSDSPDLGVFNLEFTGTTYSKIWKAQVSVDDGIGSILFTASVYIAPPPCANDKTFRYNNDAKKSCSWVGKEEKTTP